MSENNKYSKHKYNKKTRFAGNLHDSERNINSSDSIKVTIMNDINTKWQTLDEYQSGQYNDSVVEEGEDDSFLLKIIFSNNKKYSELKSNVFNSIKQGLNDRHLIMKENDDKNFIEIFENIDGNIDSNTEATDAIGAGELFTIDTEPEQVEKNTQKSKVINIPVYSKDKFANVLLMDEDANQKSNAPKKNRSHGMSCFNCGENHNLKDCKKPRQHAKIQQRISAVKGVERYHVEPNQKYANLVPGKLSKVLRDALGLRKTDIPSHVYRMRLFGYPPGWLEDHKISNSGLNLFDSDGNTVENTGEEQGEIVEKEQYDLNKIIEFPGFNVPPTKNNQYDDYHRNRVPPMSEKHSKEAMISCLSDKLVTPYKRKKLVNFPGANIKTDGNNVEEQCMDIEDDDDNFCGPLLPPGIEPPLPDEDISDSNPPPPPPPPLDATISNDSNESGELISDDDDKAEKKTNNNAKPVTILPEATPSAILQVQTETIELNEKIACVETSEFNLCTTKFETKGTPLLQFSPYTSLPSGDKFSVGVSDVINFENLPDSTGKYETMKEIIGRVRKQMEKMHDEL